MRWLLLAVALLTPGCALVHSAFTNPTGTITIERQQFVNTYAVVKVLYTRLRAQAQLACERGEVDCQELVSVDKQVKALNVQIEAKIAVPESEIDWETVKELLKALVSLVP